METWGGKKIALPSGEFIVEAATERALVLGVNQTTGKSLIEQHEIPAMPVLKQKSEVIVGQTRRRELMAEAVYMRNIQIAQKASGKKGLPRKRGRPAGILPMSTFKQDNNQNDNVGSYNQGVKF